MTELIAWKSLGAKSHIRSWRNNWEGPSNEAVHRQFRKFAKTKSAFPNENSLLKLRYLGIQNASKKWTMPIQN